MTVNAYWGEKMTDDRKPRLVNLKCEKSKKLGIIKVLSFDVSNKETIECGDSIIFIELEPTLQLMKEMGEALESANGWIRTHVMQVASCEAGENEELLEKYRNFLEGIEK